MQKTELRRSAGHRRVPVGWMPAALCAAAALAMGAAPALAERRAWLAPELTRRAYLTVPGEFGRKLLVRIPTEPDNPAAPPFAAFDAAGGTAECQVAFASEREVFVLVAARNADRGREYAIYFGSDPKPGFEPPPPEPDPTPVQVEVIDAGGHAVPNSWEKMRYMMAQGSRSGELSYYPSLDALGEARSQEKRDRQRIVIARSYLLCASEAVYRFAVDCEDAGFLLLDGQLVAEWPGEHDGGAWREGGPVLVKAGPRRLEFVSRSARRRPQLRIGWRPEDQASVAPLPASLLLAAVAADPVRVERLSQTLHPSFVTRQRRAYQFAGCDATFFPVEFRSTTENWLSTAVRCRWEFGDGSTGEGAAAGHVYTRPGVYAATLEVRDGLGFVRRWQDTVDCRETVPRPYSIHGEMTALPAVCYAADTVEPRLRLATSFPWTNNLSVTGELAMRDGRRRAMDVTDLNPFREDSCPVVAGRAGDVAWFAWSVKHQGVEIEHGRVEFLTPPFARLPARVDGDRLYDAEGVRLVLIPDAGPGPTAPGLGRSALRIVCVDDSLVPATDAKGPVVAYDQILASALGQRVASVTRIQIPDWSARSEAYGPLLKLALVPELVDRSADVVVLSVGLRDMLDAVPPPAFERQAAALCDIIAGTRRQAVVWVAPPPYPPDADRVRPYAAAVQRMAEARGIRVADLYSAFRSAGERDGALFSPDSIAPSARGQLLAARVIGSVLLDGMGDTETWRSTRWNSVFGSLR